MLEARFRRHFPRWPLSVYFQKTKISRSKNATNSISKAKEILKKVLINKNNDSSLVT